LLSLHIIGGTGFFGKSFLEKENLKLLKKNNITKLILSARKIKFKIKKSCIKISFKKIDITSTKSLPFTDYIIYAAASAVERNYKKKGLKKQKQNAKKGIKNFIRILKNKKFNNTKILFTSSGAVYGINKYKRKIKESKKIHKKNLDKLTIEKYSYALSKIFAEKKLLEFSKKFNRKIIIARCFAFIGENIYLKEHFLIGNLIYGVLNKHTVKIKSSNTKGIFRSFLSSKNLVNVLIKILKFNMKSNYEITNVGSSNSLSVFELIKLFQKKFSLKVILPEQKNNKIIDFYIPCLKHLKESFNIKLHENLERDIIDVIKFNKKKINNKI
jgi:dTDP-glucose 4,6-dehydratase